MLAKLSRRNAKRQAKDYLIYFITVTISVALIFAFNSLVFSSEIQGLSNMMDSMSFIVIGATILVVFIIGWLVYYTTRFMLRKRGRELGTYMLLGIDTKRVARMFFMENIIIGAVALVLGILGGSLVFQLMRAMILHVFEQPFTLRFDFSFGTVALTIIYAALIFLFALLKSRKQIKKMKIYDLLYMSKQNEDKAIKRKSASRIVFITSIISGIVGVVVISMMPAMKISPSEAQLLILVGGILIIYFLFGFYLSFSAGVTKFFEKRKTRKYKKDHMFLFRALTSKMTSMSVTMAVLALLFTLTLSTLGFGMQMNTRFDREHKMITPFDMYISNTGTQYDFADYDAYINEHLDVKESLKYEIYDSGNAETTMLMREYRLFTIDSEVDNVMRYSDYVVLRRMLGYKDAVELPADGYILHCMAQAIETIGPLLESTYRIGDAEYKHAGTYTEDFMQYSWDGNGSIFLIVVPDAAVEPLARLHSIYALMFDTNLTIQQHEELTTVAESHNSDQYDHFLRSQVGLKNDAAMLYTMMVFPLFYIAMILGMTAATILTIQQLSDAESYRYQYSMLRKLGVSEKSINRTIRKQMMIFYALPVVPAVIISIALIMTFGTAITTGMLLNSALTLGQTGIAIGAFLVLYLVYFAAAHLSFKRTVTQDA